MWLIDSKSKASLHSSECSTHRCCQPWRSSSRDHCGGAGIPTEIKGSEPIWIATDLGDREARTHGRHQAAADVLIGGGAVNSIIDSVEAGNRAASPVEGARAGEHSPYAHSGAFPVAAFRQDADESHPKILADSATGVTTGSGVPPGRRRVANQILVDSATGATAGSGVPPGRRRGRRPNPGGFGYQSRPNPGERNQLLVDSATAGPGPLKPKFPQ